ncbi:unnamed protein product [Leptosia nina]|uniref:BTB domain-containing protein n=1 Tax=Leptosia nina TaxID=320188 RepID=A0AAV1JXZ8_9NEOP
MTPQQYCLRWKHHHSNVQSMFSQLLEKERFCDVTLYCSSNFSTQTPNKERDTSMRGVSLKAHRVVLAACSELLATLLGAHEAQGEPVLVIDGAEPVHVRALLDYMYTGEMNVHHSQLAGLLKTAEELRIKGLTDIRWSNKDEPPDSTSGAVTTTQKNSQTEPKPESILPDINVPDKSAPDKNSNDVRNSISNDVRHDLGKSPVRTKNDIHKEAVDSEMKNEHDVVDVGKEKFTLNGGPPPLIKLPVKDKSSALLKRDISDTQSESQSPKRQRLTSGTEHTDDELSSQTVKSEKDQEWRHGNLNISVERIVGWGAGEAEIGEWSRDASDDEWADAPADIGSFLHTKLRVDGDNSADEESDDSATAMPEALAHASSSSSTTSTSHVDMPKSSKSSGNCVDPRFSDVVKLNDYLRHGRRPQFWEENYVKRVMDAVRLKELEMKQAAEILGVSYGTLYGRYRDVYGCINRPYRTARDFWQAKGPSEILDRVQRGEIGLEAAALALGVNPSKLAAYVADGSPILDEKSPMPLILPSYMPEPSPKKRDVESGTEPEAVLDQNQKNRPRSYLKKETNKARKVTTNMEEDLSLMNSSFDNQFTSPQATQSSAWPSIRVASIESLRGGDNTPSPSQLMKTRPDLTIIAAKRDKDET